MQTPDEMIAAIEAFKRDGKVQLAHVDGSRWGSTDRPCWDFVLYQYRPVPKPKEIWVNEYSEAPMRAHQSQENALKNAGNNIIRKAVRYIEADPQ